MKTVTKIINWLFCLFWNGNKPNQQFNREVNEQIKIERDAFTGVKEELEKRDSRLSSMYIGAVTIFEEGDSNPEYLVHSGHSFREMMEKLPRYINVEVEDERPSTGELLQKIRHLQEAHSNVQQQSDTHDNGEWNGTIDTPLQNFMESVKSFLQWISKHYPSKREAFTGGFKTEQSPYSLPEHVQRNKFETWKDLRGFFIGVSHHNFEPSEKQFRRKMIQLENFILNELSPAVTDDRDKIDEYIERFEDGE